jgi:hypothetical protein
LLRDYFYSLEIIFALIVIDGIVGLTYENLIKKAQEGSSLLSGFTGNLLKVRRSLVHLWILNFLVNGLRLLPPMGIPLVLIIWQI